MLPDWPVLSMTQQLAAKDPCKACDVAARLSDSQKPYLVNASACFLGAPASRCPYAAGCEVQANPE